MATPRTGVEHVTSENWPESTLDVLLESGCDGERAIEATRGAN
jgi:hypothetical protein